MLTGALPDGRAADTIPGSFNRTGDGDAGKPTVRYPVIFQLST